MSNISRRDFMKTAGVMTLAVAASGVLAGCSTAAADNKVTEVTSNSVTVGDYTITIKDAKRYSVKGYTDTTDGSATAEDQYLCVLVNVKANKDDSESAFMMVPSSYKNIDTSATAGVTAAKLKDLLGLSVEPTLLTSITDTISATSSSAIANRTADGSPYCYAFKLIQTTYTDETWEFKTPALAFNVTSGDGIKDAGELVGATTDTVKLTATVPTTAESKKASDLGLK